MTVTIINFNIYLSNSVPKKKEKKYYYVNILLGKLNIYAKNTKMQISYFYCHSKMEKKKNFVKISNVITII